MQVKYMKVTLLKSHHKRHNTSSLQNSTSSKNNWHKSRI